MMVKLFPAAFLMLALGLPAMAQTGAPVAGRPGPDASSAAPAPRSPFVPTTIDTDIGAMRASRIIGMSVFNDKEEKIGTVDDLVIGADRSLHAIVSVGGFLGFGSAMVDVPFQRLQFSNAKGATNRATLPGATKQSLGAMQRFVYSRQG